jgi:hypothetical protein
MRAKSAQNGHIARELLALRDPDKMLDMKAMEGPKCRPSRWHIEPVIRAKSFRTRISQTNPELERLAGNLKLAILQ